MTLRVRERACADAEEGEEALRAMQIPDFIGPEAQEHAVDLAWAVLGALALVIGVVNYLGRRGKNR